MKAEKIPKHKILPGKSSLLSRVNNFSGLNICFFCNIWDRGTWKLNKKSVFEDFIISRIFVQLIPEPFERSTVIQDGISTLPERTGSDR